VIAPMTSAMAPVVIRVPRLEVNRAAELAPGREGRSASQAAGASRSLGCAGTVRDFSPLRAGRRTSAAGYVIGGLLS
jgi:hypothetical protein